MSQGISFYVQYSLPVPLLAVALYTLERNYNGNIHVICGDQAPRWFESELRVNQSITAERLTKIYWPEPPSRKYKACWYTKPYLHDVLPFEVNLMYDCDTLFVSRFDMSIFDKIQRDGLVNCHHRDKDTPEITQAKVRKRTVTVNDSLGLDLPLLFGVNGGCVGSARGGELITEWQERMVQLYNTPSRRWRVADEYALAITMALHGLEPDNPRWHYTPFSRRQQHVDQVIDEQPDLIAVHMSQYRYRGSQYFARAITEAVADDYMGIRTNWKKYAECNDYVGPILNKSVLAVRDLERWERIYAIRQQ